MAGVDEILIDDVEAFNNKKQRIVAGGASKLQVVVDFDRTLTKPFVNGKTGLTTYGVLSCDVLSDKFQRVENELFQKYHKYEVDPLMTREEKFPLMVEWWQLANKNLIEEKVTRRMISQMIKKVDDRFAFRDGVQLLFNDLEGSGVPVLILSAGLGDTINLMIESHLDGGVRPNMHVVSNFLRYNGEFRRISLNENDKQHETEFEDEWDRAATGFLNAVAIHVLNKDESEIRGTPYYNEVANRPNVVLVGDHLGDLKMADGLQHNERINIGFLNDKGSNPVTREAYMKAFDVVIIGKEEEGTFNFVNNLLTEILATK